LKKLYTIQVYLNIKNYHKDFNIHTQWQTHTHVWIRLRELPQEYWMERTLYEIARAVKTPFLIDNVTNNRLVGHYARLLVDLDLSKEIFHEVVVEREGFAFPVAIEYEGLPEFCTHCKNIGHNVTSCRWLHPRKADKVEHPVDKGKKPVNSQRQKQGWKSWDNSEGIGSSKAFEIAASNQQKDAHAETPQGAHTSTNSASDSFSFDVQHVTDDIPHGAMSTSPVLEHVP